MKFIKLSTSYCSPIFFTTNRISLYTLFLSDKSHVNEISGATTTSKSEEGSHSEAIFAQVSCMTSGNPPLEENIAHVRAGTSTTSNPSNPNVFIVKEPII